MEEDIQFQEEESEYISISQLRKSFLESDQNIQSVLKDISQIYQKSSDSQIKSEIRSILKQQLSKHSVNLQQSLSNLSFSLDEEKIEGSQEEQEEQKQNYKNDQNQRQSVLLQQNLVQFRNSNDQLNNVSSVRMSDKSVNNFQPNFYRDLNNIQFSRELNYFHNPQISNERQILDLFKESKVQIENDVDTLQFTDKPSQLIINDEVYQRRQSEKKKNNLNYNQDQSNCSSFIRDGEEQDLVDQGQINVLNRQNENQMIENISITDDNNQNISLVKNSNRSSSQLSQNNSKEIQIQNNNQDDQGQNIEGKQLLKQKKNLQRKNRNNFFNFIINNKKSILILISVIAIALAVLMALKPNLMLQKYFDLFKENFQSIQIRELKASLQTQVNYSQKLEQQIKDISEKMESQEREFDSIISKLKEELKYQKELQQITLTQKEIELQNQIRNLEQEKQQIKQLLKIQQEQHNLNVNNLQQSLQASLQKQEALQQSNNLIKQEKSNLQQELNEVNSKYDQLKELYDNLQQVLELFKKTSL